MLDHAHGGSLSEPSLCTDAEPDDLRKREQLPDLTCDVTVFKSGNITKLGRRRGADVFADNPRRDYDRMSVERACRWHPVGSWRGSLPEVA